VPVSAQIDIATRDHRKFVNDPASGRIMATINNSALNYGADTSGFAGESSISPDGKSLYYHVNDNGVFAINRVTRKLCP
jgi:hypothetical protein